MIQINERGGHISDNVLDNLLSFNSTSTWSEVGTGYGAVDTNIFFEGKGSLKIENTAYKTTDLTVNNTTQSTVVKLDGTYDLSLYLRKTLAEDVSVTVEVYKNGASLYSTPFTFAETQVDEWFSFCTNENWSLSKGDIITFKFKINQNASSSVTNAVIRVDGMHLYNKERNQLEAPIYKTPLLDLYNLYTGFGNYSDTVYTTSSPFTVIDGATAVNLPNNAGSIYEAQKPIDIDTFYDGSVITGRNGDGINITTEFKCRPTGVGADPRLTVSIDIGGGIGELYKRDFFLNKGSGVEHNFLTSFNAYTLDTWEANGGTVKISATNEDIEIYDIRYVITRTHKAR